MPTVQTRLMQIPAEHISEVLRCLRDWGFDIDESTEEDLFDEYDRRPTAGVNVLGGFRKTDPSTSAAAAMDNLPRSGSQKSKVLRAICQAGERGLTAHEAVSETDVPYRSITPRIGELKASGWVQSNGKTRTTDMGSKAEVLVATRKATLKVRL